MDAVIVDATSNSLPYDTSLCEALHRRGARVVLACSRLPSREALRTDFETWEWFYDTAHRPFLVRAGHRVRRIVRGMEHVLDMRRLLAAIRARRPSVVHFQWLPLPVIDRSSMAAIRRVAPVVLTLHNSTLERGQFGSKLQQIGYRSAVRRADAVVVHTAFSRDRVLAAGLVEEQRLHVIPHGALEYYRSLGRPEPDVPNVEGGRPVLLFFGAIAWYKGVDLLLRAFATLPDEVRAQCDLVIAGKAACDVDSLKRLAQSLGIGASVRWDVRYVPEAELAALVRAADVVVFPYRSIDQSGALMTAIAFDKPVVATRVGGFSEIIRDGEHGYLVASEDVPQLSKAIASLILDKATRARMKLAVRNLRLTKLGWDSIAEKTVSLYERLQSRC